MSKLAHKDLTALNAILAQILNTDASINDLLELRTKLGVPLYKCSISDPVNTMNILTVILKNAKFSPRYSIILVACTSFTFQFVPKRERQRIMEKLDIALPIHAVPDDADLFTTFGTFYQLGGAELIPCKCSIFKKLVNHPDNKIKSSPKLIEPLLKEDLTRLSQILYESRNPECITVSDLFLFGQLHATLKLPKPKDQNLIEALKQKCMSIISIDSPFYDMEAALSCLSVLISWKVAEPPQSILEIENPSLKALAIFCYTEKVRVSDITDVPDLLPSNDPIILTAYLRLFVTSIKKEDANIHTIKIPHWIVSAVYDEFYSDVCPFDLITKSPSIFELSTEDISLICSMYEYIPSWLFLHFMRSNTKSISVLKSCISVITLAPEPIITRFISDFILFFRNCIQHGELIDPTIEMLQSLSSVLLPHMSDLYNVLIEEFNASDSGKLQMILRAACQFANLTGDTFPLTGIFDLVMESFDSIPLSPSVINSLFKLFEKTAVHRPKFHMELLMMALAFVCAPFDRHIPDEFLTKRANGLSKRAAVFFSVIESDVVANPRFNIGTAFPPLPTALRLIANLSSFDHSIDSFLADCIVDALSLCPYESVLAIAAVPVPLRSSFYEAADALTNVCDRASFNIALSKLNHNEPKHVIAMTQGEDFRFIMHNNPDFVPILSQYPSHLRLLIEASFPSIDPAAAGILITSSNAVTPLLRRIADKFSIAQPALRPGTWAAVEFGGQKTMNARWVGDFLTLPECPTDLGEAVNAFRVRFPVTRMPSVTETALAAMKAHHRDRRCYRFLNAMFAENASQLVALGGEKLWLLSLGVPYTNPFGLAGDEKARLFAARKQSITFAEPGTLEWSEVVKVSGPQKGDEIGGSLAFYSGFLFPCFDPSLPPSLLFRVMRGAASGDDAIDEGEAAYIGQIFSAIDAREPLIVREALELLKNVLKRSGPYTSSACNPLFVSILRDATPSAAAATEALPVLKEAAKEMSVFEGGRSLLKKFQQQCVNSKVDVDKHHPNQ